MAISAVRRENSLCSSGVAGPLLFRRWHGWKEKNTEREVEHIHLREGNNKRARTQDYNLKVYYISPANGEQGSSSSNQGDRVSHPSWVAFGAQSIRQRPEVLWRNGSPPGALGLGQIPGSQQGQQVAEGNGKSRSSSFGSSGPPRPPWSFVRQVCEGPVAERAESTQQKQEAAVSDLEIQEERDQGWGVRREA